MTAAVAVAVAGLSAVPAASEPEWNPSDPIVLTGPMPDGAKQLMSVKLLLNPTSQSLGDLEVGEETPPVAERNAGDFVVQDGEFAVTLDPADVPAGYMQDGVLDVAAYLDTESGAYVTSAAVRAVALPGEMARSEGEDVLWVGAADSSGWAGQFGRTKAAGHVLALAGDDTPDTPVSDVNEVEIEDDGVPSTEPVAMGNPDPPAGCTYTKLRERTRPTTIGTTYPVGGDNAKMVIDSSMGAEYGEALSVATPSGWGAFKYSGSRFVKSSWGFEWAGSSKARSYRKGLEYGLFLLDCVRGCWECNKEWMPTGETGGTGSNVGITRPNWGNCRSQDKGSWWRDNADGRAYEYSGAVKFKDIIGLDLSIKRQYSSTQRLYYNFAVDGRKMCGNNDWPAVAGKVMEKLG